MTEASEKTRGGKREGAGRPKIKPCLKKEPLSVRIAQWRIDFLNKREEITGESRAVLTEKALDAYYKLEPPK